MGEGGSLVLFVILTEAHDEQTRQRLRSLPAAQTFGGWWEKEADEEPDEEEADDDDDDLGALSTVYSIGDNV